MAEAEAGAVFAAATGRLRRARAVLWERLAARGLALGLTVCLASWAVSGLRPACAAQLSGVVMPDEISLGGSTLVLNGIGLRTVFIVKAWVAGLYVPAASQDPGELLRQSGPRRLQMKMLVDISPERMMKNLMDGLHANSGATQVAQLKPQLDQLAATLRLIGYARKGDVLDLDLIEGQLHVAINGQIRGEPIAGEEFFGAILRAFIGEHPVDKDLKKGLLAR